MSELSQNAGKSPASSALVLFSGGQDSATCLAWSLERFERVETVGFDYGQRHAVEMQARLNVREGMMKAPRSPEVAHLDPESVLETPVLHAEDGEHPGDRPHVPIRPGWCNSGRGGVIITRRHRH